MTSLAYLWDRDQEELLQEMIDKGMVVILIKTAAAGLDPRKHLGKTIAELKDYFLKIVSLLKRVLVNFVRKRNGDLTYVEKEENMSQ